jgi:uncharacterized protein (DUF1499 family)
MTPSKPRSSAWLKRIVLWPLGIIFSFVIAMIMVNQFASRPANLGVVEGKLAICPDKPNVVCSQATDSRHAIEPFAIRGTASESMQGLRELIAKQSRMQIIAQTDDYLHVEARTLLLRFVDDVEFYVDREKGVIHIRSASRVGYSDMGVNRKRMENLRTQWLAMPLPG